MAMSFQGTGSFDQLAGPYFGGAPFYTPPPPPSEGIFGAYPDYFYRAAGPSQQPHHPSEADRIKQGHRTLSLDHLLVFMSGMVNLPQVEMEVAMDNEGPPCFFSHELFGDR